MINNHSRQLYQSLSTNHQPLPILSGAVLAKVIPYETLFQLVDRLRLSMWGFAVVGSLLVVWRYRWSGVLASVLTYSLGYYFFAWHVLAESLVIPAVIWIMLELLQKFFGSKLSPSSYSKSVNLLSHFLTGFYFFWLTFNLLPIWPFVFLASCSLWWLATKIERWLMLLGGVLPTLILFLSISPAGWWQQTAVNNVLYFIPFEAPHDLLHYLRILLYPWIHLVDLGQPVARLYLMCAVLIAFFIYQLKKNGQLSRSSIKWLVLLGAMLLSLNLRTSIISASFYQGFHVFPYFAGVASVASFLLTKWWNETAQIISAKSQKKIPNLNLTSKTNSQANQMMQLLKFWPVALLIIGVLSSSSWIIEIKDKVADHHVQYHEFASLGAALRTLVRGSLMTGPDGAGYLNMVSGLPLAGDQNFHLEWAYGKVPVS